MLDTTELDLAVIKAITAYCIPHIDCAGMTDEQFAMARRNGLGASDASIYLGLQDQWRTESDLIANKLATKYTDEEKEVSMKPAVRKGKDLEPLILQKFTNLTGIPCVKPSMMYKLKEFPYLTISFDGVGLIDNEVIPIEAKFTSTYGDKYWNFKKGLSRNGQEEHPPQRDPFTISSIVAHCEEAGEYYGVPAYYYVQVQQQMLGLNSPWGYLTSLRDKDWEIYAFHIKADPWIQKQIILEGHRVSQRIETQRKYAQS